MQLDDVGLFLDLVIQLLEDVDCNGEEPAGAVAIAGTVLSAVADVEASAALYRTSVQCVQLLAERRDDAVRALDLAEARYAAGAIDQLALIDAQRTRRSAAIDLAAAIADHRIAVVQLYRAVGATV